ncbi:N-acetylglucosaminyl-diphospho-decaprenol L-rhamnosyltransferase [Cryobacterium flavum]|uniref:Glycosyltransferase family 2 protein n=1 Tax=Cryobacterium flavum TaxID=1424659 RepID=A0A4R8V0B0_9MICO|nr:glycosyltransferase family 2 protein [Cryobacterium flavum]TFB74222.1 glycosyltransferase family 2 protein [Cryobacterium flavum]SDO16040.1 N-acetylglucosaminyl-diphospho-decaprenol L-rhamnosyltransferase [Cryobacterium flavum]
MSTVSKPPASTARVAVVTVSYGSEDVLGPFLASLPSASRQPLHVVVADNKPAATTNAVESMTTSAGGTYLSLPSNRGYGYAINTAVRELGPEIDWVVVSNPDVTVNPGCIDILLESVLDSSIAAVGPRILSSDGEVYPSARTVPSLRSGVGHAIFANFWPKNPWTRNYRRESEIEPVRRDAGWLSGAFLMIRRSVFDQIDGFDESYFMYFEDVDLGYRIGRLGLRNVYEPAAAVVHTGAHSTSTHDESAGMIRAHHESAQKFLFKKYSGPWLGPLRLLLAVGLGLRSRLEARRSAR